MAFKNRSCQPPTRDGRKVARELAGPIIDAWNSYGLFAMPLGLSVPASYGPTGHKWTPGSALREVPETAFLHRYVA